MTQSATTQSATAQSATALSCQKRREQTACWDCSRLPQAAQLAVAARAVAVGLSHPLGVGAALVCLATSSYLRARRSIGGSGADQLRFIVLVVVGLVWAAGWTPTARFLGDLFLAAQVALAYFTAGVAKAVSAT